MARIPTNSTTSSTLFAPMRVERRDEKALKESKCTKKNRIKHNSAIASAIVTSHIFSGAKLITDHPGYG